MGISPGTLEGRKKGGIVSQRNRKLRPEYYKKLGCSTAKEFIFPERSEKLAELFGIILGDGSLTRFQLHITLNSEADREYIVYVSKLIKILFGEEPYLYKKKEAQAVVLVINGVNLVNFFISNGLVLGNKVFNQVGVPNWIGLNKSYSKSCLRGLVDTDGGLFIHSYISNGKEYSYRNLNFTNMSRPLLNFVFNTLTKFEFNPKMQSINKVWLYSKKDIKKYFEFIGSSNFRLLRHIEI
jgi:hypothetical protein